MHSRIMSVYHLLGGPALKPPSLKVLLWRISLPASYLQELKTQILILPVPFKAHYYGLGSARQMHPFNLKLIHKEARKYF